MSLASNDLNANPDVEDFRGYAQNVNKKGTFNGGGWLKIDFAVWWMAVETPHARSSMAFGPPLAASFSTFFYAVCKDLFVYIKHKRRRVKDLLEHFAELEGEVEDLKAHWDDINEKIDHESWSRQKNKRFTPLQNKLSRCRSDFEKIKEKYATYCVQIQRPQAAEASGEANVDQAIVNPEQKIWTQKFFKLAQLDKDIFKLTPKIISVRNELQVENLTCQLKPEFVKRMEADELKDIVPSHEKHLADLKKYLCQENCKRIGIYGLPAVGKTNIMKNLNNCFDPSPPSDCNLDLDYVIWITVPGAPNKEKMIENIQEKIIQRLKIDWQKNRSPNAADIISTALSKKKYLLFLDGFSSLIELEEIGINKEHKDGKVVIAARDLRAMSNVVFDKEFKVDPLPDEERKKLFYKFVEFDTLRDEQKGMVDLILKALGGLPGVIRATAKHLNKYRDQDTWEGFKQRLKSNIDTSELLGLGGLVNALKLLYEDLKMDCYKKCLLYTALFPNEYTILRSTLVEYWKAEQYLSCRLSTMKAARCEGKLVFNCLEESGLLQSCGAEHVKIQEYFRTIALGQDEYGESIVRSGPEIDGHLKKREWNTAKRVSLIRSKLEKLPFSPRCDHMSTLLLQLNPNLRIIRDPFFKTMKKIRVLDLHRTGITSLPPSISYLTELRCLYLNNCDHLAELPSQIVELKKLEVLDIQGTSIPCLPKEIRRLISLKCLRISFDSEACNPNPEPKRRVPFNSLKTSPERGTWVIFPPGIADKLHKLEELTVDLGRTRISEEILNRIKKEASEFKSTKVFFNDCYIQRLFQSLDQENLIQNGEGTNLPNPSLPENPGQDPMTEIQSPRSGNKGPSNLQSGSTRGRTDSSYQASKKDKGKGIEIPNPKNKASGVDIKIRELPETNACPPDIQEEYDIPNQEIERALGDVVDRPNFSAGASTSGTAGRAD